MFFRQAVAVANGDGYGPTAFFPPGMALTLAAMFKVFGASPRVGQALNILVSVALVTLTYRIGRGAAGESAGRLSALLVAFNPTLVFYTATLGYELLLGMLLLGISAMQLPATVSLRSLLGRAAAAGIVLGYATLVKPVSLLMPFILGLVWARRISAARTAIAISVAFAALAFVVAPWLARNARVVDAPVISTNGGVVLYSANNPSSRGIASPVSPLEGEVDEVSRDRLRRAAAIDWILQHPADWARLAVDKVVYTWGTTSSIMSFVSYDRMPRRQEDACKAVLNIWWAAMCALCLAAALRTRVWSNDRLFGWHLVVLYVFALHLLFEALSRHHIPVIPVLSVQAAVFLASQAGRPEPAVAEVP
jgi:4-amino-4-deoxy-L-arabinose transferase-like glycosyltransferase